MLRIRQIKVPVSNPNLEHKLASILRINQSDLISYKILKKSIDARDKRNVCFVYECAVELKNESKVKLSKDIEKYIEEKYIFPYKKNTNKKIVIIGSGPAGLFCAYTLASNGYKVEVIERGEKVEDRMKTVEEFWNTGKLNKNSNVQFGEGGAGTF
ncbi:MAG: NAD(P)/FAD-dependent oxidoreductase, partial [Bacilli bacterium]|nr:NAD(P)/FAD-dependent oxidoreductase [Bacilli bacterium]